MKTQINRRKKAEWKRQWEQRGRVSRVCVYLGAVVPDGLVLAILLAGEHTGYRRETRSRGEEMRREETGRSRGR